jgi:flagellin
MASILTNTGAMTALQTLRGINKNLGTVQSQISTGKKVATAKDNAASFAIAAVMKSDVAGFKALSESLATGSATVGVARAGAETVVDLLEELKGRIVAANSDSADRSKIQADVAALRNQIVETVNASQFNGLNLLQANTNDRSTEVLSSLNRTSTGVTATNINVARQSLQAGTLGANVDKNTAAAAAFTGLGGLTRAAYAVGDVIAIQLTDRDATSPVTASIAYTITQADINAATDNAFATAVAAGLQAAVTASGFNTEATANNRVTFSANTNNIEWALTGAGTNGVRGNLSTTASGGLTNGENNFNLTALNAINVGNKAGATSALSAIEGMIQTAVTAAANFGSAQKRIELQSEFVKNLTDSLTTGIGALVDADLEAASARLQALQVQQQLGTQSLSIANQAPQNILSLFR